MEFPFSREARRRLGIADDFTGDLASARLLARRLDQLRDVARHPERGVRAGLLFSLFALHRWSRRLFEEYLEAVDGDLWRQVHGWLEDRFGPLAVATLLQRFRDLFGDPAAPPEEEPVASAGGDPAPRDLDDLASVVELWLINRNPATAELRELFDDAELEEATGYGAMMTSLEELFEALPPIDGESLWQRCQRPQREMPASLRGQLEVIAADEAADGGDHLLALDVLAEEERPVFPHGGPPPPPPEVRLEDLQEGEERFSSDRRWMPELVLVAKNALVWLHQLSQAWERDISTLDAIPDAELDRLAERGFTGLWLIGLWRRSAASQTIKHRSGNPSAGASAYSVDAYEVADELGGEAALDDLRQRAWQRGLRLACDMVPNHFGIDSEWVRRYPERFLSRPDCPFPNYTFSGPDLSSSPEIGIFLEDGYWDRSDAAVVFQRVDRRRGEVAFVYHGNDGTVTPWNDTAQLDYLQPEVQEAVIDLILEVAQRFPVIRFDAAMTLARRHIQRLWYPLPGRGGDIPSRAEYALSDEEFQRRMPEEFWRRVVDRVAEEAPDTLLLAEAFWLMESFFVRTLGMHRVYNSAFMHMLRDESNDKFHRSLEKILEFEPGILQRYVNFLSNPDEETAVEQFGQHDKYFAACVLLVTLPGLPLFGHGQWEGLREKYGMEYRRSFRDELPDDGLIAHHDRVITPLLERRRLFAEVESFRLLEFTTAEGHDRNVFAFVNRRGDERAVVWVHNRAATSHGRVTRSVAFVDREGEPLRRETLGEALAIAPRTGDFWIFRDLVAGGERLISSRQLVEEGLVARLGPYETRVYGDFRRVQDHDGRYGELARELAGGAIDDIEATLRRRRGSPLREPFARLLPRVLAPDGEAELTPLLLQAYGAAVRFARGLEYPALPEAVASADHATGEPRPVESDEEAPAVDAAGSGGDDAAVPLASPGEGGAESLPEPGAEQRSDDALVRRCRDRGLDNLRAVEGLEAAGRWRRSIDADEIPALRLWAVIEPLVLIAAEEAPRRGRDLLDDAVLLPELEDLVGEVAAVAIRLFTDRREWWHGLPRDRRALALVDAWAEDEAVRHLLQLHRFDGESWFRQEGFRVLLRWLTAMAAVGWSAGQAAAEEQDRERRDVDRRSADRRRADRRSADRRSADRRSADRRPPDRRPPDRRPPAFVGPLLEDLMAAEAPSGYRWQELRQLLGAPPPADPAAAALGFAEPAGDLRESAALNRDDPVPGGPVPGGPVPGGPVPGGPVPGGPVPGGPVQGGPVQGGPVSGDSVPGVTVSEAGLGSVGPGGTARPGEGGQADASSSRRREGGDGSDDGEA